MELLRETLLRDVPWIATSSQGEVLEASYSPFNCRSACLQRLIWDECHCLDFGLKLPFFQPSLFCGAFGENVTNAKMFFNPKKYNREHCLDWNKDNLELEECSFLHNVVDSLACMKRVKHIHAQDEHMGGHKCSCPAACKSYEYDLKISQSIWPASGIETDTAYSKLVEKGLVQDYKKFNSPAAETIVNYLSDMNNRDEIMKNFARVTIYNERLSIERVEQVEAYTGEDLISDIGESHTQNI